MRDLSRELPEEENAPEEEPISEEEHIPEEEAILEEEVIPEEASTPEKEELPPEEEEQPLSEDEQAPEEPDLPEPSPEAHAPSRQRVSVTRDHPLWRGWWLAICLLSIAVLMGQVDAFGVAWRHQPWRAFGGAVAAGGFLAALPGLIKGQLPERPMLRRCLLGLLCGAVWGVLG